MQAAAGRLLRPGLAKALAHWRRDWAEEQRRLLDEGYRLLRRDQAIREHEERMREHAKVKAHHTGQADHHHTSQADHHHHRRPSAADRHRRPSPSSHKAGKGPPRGAFATPMLAQMMESLGRTWN